MLPLSFAFALTVLLYLCCRGLPPFVPGEVRCNEVVAFYLLLMLARFWCMGAAVPRCLPDRIALGWGVHVLLGLCSLIVFCAWMQQMDPAHAAVNRWRAGTFFALPVATIGFLAVALVAGRVPFAALLGFAVCAAATLGLAGWTVLTQRREAREAQAFVEAREAPREATPAAPAPQPEKEPALAPVPLPADVATRRDALVASILAGEMARAAAALRGLWPPGTPAASAAEALFARAPSFVWAACETLGDHLRQSDPELARLCYHLALAGLDVERSQATAAGEAYAATETMRAVDRRLTALGRP